MSPAIQSVCLFCQHRPLLYLLSDFPLQTWQFTRAASQLQRRRAPSRMALSPKVSRRPEKDTSTGRPERRSTQGPFSGMNRTTANLRYAPRPRSASELKRSTRGREKPQNERETFHALKMQKALTPITYGQRTSIKNRIVERNSFEHFRLSPTVKESVATQALAGMVDISPTPIQRLAIPAILGDDSRANRRRVSATQKKEMEQVLLAAETGSGKTLAYLLPVLDAIKRAEAIDADLEAQREVKEQEEEEKKRMADPFYVKSPDSDAPHPTTGRPRAIILLPTSELVTQVGSVVKLLSHKIKFRSALISSAYSGKVIRNRLFTTSGVDVLISTPHLLASISESDPNILSRVSHLVIDEADSLLDRSFAPSTSTIIAKTTPSLEKLILCSATIPRSLDSYLRRTFPDMRRLVTPNLHAVPRRVQLGVIDVEKDPYRGNKLLACADTIWSIGKAGAETVSSDADTKRILVFVNEREKTQEVAEYLNMKGIDAIALNRDTPEQRQSETLKPFTIINRDGDSAQAVECDTSPTPSAPTHVPWSPDPTSSSAPTFSIHRGPTPIIPQAAVPDQPRRRLPNTKVLVSTDLGSRGIDTLAVRHVILFDVPHSTIDFIHRLGRTGRMGRRGRGIVLVGKHDRRDVVREVREGMFRGQALI